LLNNKPTLSIVCLTNWIRIELGNVESGKIYQYLPIKDKKYFKNDWHPYLAYTTFLRQIISLQSIANTTNNRLLFLDTFNNNLNRTPTFDWFVELMKLGDVFTKMNDDRLNKKFNTVVALTKHIDYNMFLSEDSYQTLIAGYSLIKGHPVKDGHEKIANFIYNKIK
jgi:hypothetical protein